MNELIQFEEEIASDLRRRQQKTFWRLNRRTLFPPSAPLGYAEVHCYVPAFFGSRGKHRRQTQDRQHDR